MNLLETSATFTSGTFALGPPTLAASERDALLSVGGTSILHAPVCSPQATDEALKSLRGFRVAGRRIVWCNAAELLRTPPADLAALGRRLVEYGGVQMLVATGAGSREVALAVRDAGLPIGRVVVCRDEASARNVLCDAINPGDAVLALGIAADNCYKLAERLESRYERAAIGAK